MVAETVRITPSDKVAEEWSPPLMEVSCVFILQNLSNKSLDLVVGFPFESDFGDSYRAIGEEEVLEMLREQNWKPGAKTEPLEGMNFRAEVDGKPVPVEFKEGAPSPDDRLLYWPIIATWKMSFKPGQALRLVNTYTTGWDYIGSDFGMTDSLTYITRTGALWAKSIGSALIEITVPPGLPGPEFSDTMSAFWDYTPGARVQGRTLTWEFSDWEPGEDIRVSVEHRDNFTVNESLAYAMGCCGLDSICRRLDWRQGYIYASFLSFLAEQYVPVMPPSLSLKVLRNLPFALAGHEFSDPVLMEIFPWGTKKVSWDDLSPKERDRVNLVKGLEKGVEANRKKADEAGYTRFLPMFALKTGWDESDISLYEGDPGAERAYLVLLENLEAAVAGKAIKDEDVAAFYELTGWYVKGEKSAYAARIKPVPAKDVTEYEVRKGYR